MQNNVDQFIFILYTVYKNSTCAETYPQRSHNNDKGCSKMTAHHCNAPGLIISKTTIDHISTYGIVSKYVPLFMRHPVLCTDEPISTQSCNERQE